MATEKRWTLLPAYSKCTFIFFFACLFCVGPIFFAWIFQTLFVLLVVVVAVAVNFCTIAMRASTFNSFLWFLPIFILNIIFCGCWCSLSLSRDIIFLFIFYLKTVSVSLALVSVCVFCVALWMCSLAVCLRTFCQSTSLLWYYWNMGNFSTESLNIHKKKIARAHTHNKQQI